MVESTGFENRHTARYREFESPPLRNWVVNEAGIIYQRPWYNICVMSMHFRGRGTTFGEAVRLCRTMGAYLALASVRS